MPSKVSSTALTNGSFAASSGLGRSEGGKICSAALSGAGVFSSAGWLDSGTDACLTNGSDAGFAKSARRPPARGAGDASCRTGFVLGFVLDFVLGFVLEVVGDGRLGATDAAGADAALRFFLEKPRPPA